MRNVEERLKFIRPQEPALVLEPPLSDDWLHEIKYDGFRIQLIRDCAGVRAFTKNGHDWSKRFWPVIDAAEKLPAKAFIIDGEMVAPDPDGRPNFHKMHARMTWNAELLAYVAFDIMHLDGQDLRPLPAIQRKKMLWDLVQPAKGVLQYSQDVEGGGAEFYVGVERLGLEGMVSKRRGSPYRSGPSDAWVKTKCWDVGEFDLLGIMREPGKQTVGLMAHDGKYAGPATIALTKQMRERLMQRVRKGGPPVGLPTAVTGSEVEWLQPGVKARVRFLRGEPKLRHASLQDIHEEDSNRRS